MEPRAVSQATRNPTPEDRKATEETHKEKTSEMDPGPPAPRLNNRARKRNHQIKYQQEVAARKKLQAAQKDASQRVTLKPGPGAAR